MPTLMEWNQTTDEHFHADLNLSLNLKHFKCMKNTTIMLGVILTFILTWMSLSFIGFLLSDPGTSFRQVATHGGVAMFMLIFGWIPSVIVGADLDSKLA